MSAVVHVGNVLDILPTLEAGSVNCVVTSQPYCACGCGESIGGIDSRGRPRRFIRGHNLRRLHNYMAQPGASNPFAGKQHSVETRRRLSEAASVPKPWLRGEANGMSGCTGAANPNWRGGGSPERQRLYAGSEWREVVRIVRERDGYRCQKCGAEKQGRKSLHLHHRKPWAAHPNVRIDPANLVTLCAGCHRREHRKGGDAL